MTSARCRTGRPDGPPQDRPVRDADNAFEHQQAPALTLARRAHGGHNGEDAVDQHVGREQDHQRQHGRARKHQGDQTEENSEEAAEREQPPVPGERIAGSDG